MSRRTIIIQSRTIKKGTFDRRSFECQVINLGSTRTYVLSETKRQLMQKHFDLTTDCLIFDNKDVYHIEEIWYTPRPRFPFISVFPIEPV